MQSKFLSSEYSLSNATDAVPRCEKTLSNYADDITQRAEDPVELFKSSNELRKDAVGLIRSFSEL